MKKFLKIFFAKDIETQDKAIADISKKIGEFSSVQKLEATKKIKNLSELKLLVKKLESERNNMVK